MKKIQFKLVFKSGPKIVHEVEGREMDMDNINFGDIHDLERSVERVTGLRCHVEQINN